ncbi:uncharacterized protein PV09_00850 [Verruconis gallopava]|uniref:Ribosome maturation protein SDO1/SBDS N-terminal domain-containing protein n=1 Tax=Verruconis gallopava TaxID=253628 RepID=A0A0D2BC49_9PEZI|nr:uncharacterized protein PV09_00850 [Verruconis gallopava]KIW08934.1 hypothetical protein PV09_00850 [Verruconis gallopava]
MRADGQITKVHYKGADEDFVVILESAEALKRWKQDKTVPLVDVVNSFDIFVTDKHGNQGVLSRASKQQLENEFGTKNADDAVVAVLEKGTVQETRSHERQGGRNEMNGPGIALAGGNVHN